MVVDVEFVVDFDFVQCLGDEGVESVYGDDLLDVVFLQWCKGQVVFGVWWIDVDLLEILGWVECGVLKDYCDVDEGEEYCCDFEEFDIEWVDLEIEQVVVDECFVVNVIFFFKVEYSYCLFFCFVGLLLEVDEMGCLILFCLFWYVFCYVIRMVCLVVCMVE